MRREKVAGDKVVRRSDGSIDYDFYRARAHHLYMVERAVFLKSLLRSRVILPEFWKEWPIGRPDAE